MTEVGPADRTRVLRSKRDEFNSIVTSRKRKLRQLYESATPDHGVSNATFTNPNATTTSPAELQFLHRCDILKSGPFDNQYLPIQPQLRYSHARHGLPSPPSPPAEVKAPSSPALPAGGEDAQARKKPHAEPPQNPTPQTTLQQNGVAPAPPVPSLPTKPVEQAPALPAQPATQDQTGAPPVRPIQPASSSIASPVTSQQPPHAQQQVEEDTKADTPVEDVPMRDVVEEDVKTAATVTGGSPLPETTGQDVMDLRLQATQNVLKPNETISSPGSTAPTATTPAVRDISADTSPDHEASRQNGVDTEPEDEATADDSKVNLDTGVHQEVVVEDATDAQDTRVPEGPEAQLLQEAMGSKASAEPPTKSGPPEPSTRPSTDEAPVEQPAEVVSTNPATPAAGPSDQPSNPVKEDTPTPLTDAKEIPDSQESGTDRMDVDVDAVTQDAVEASPEVANAPVAALGETTPTTPKPSSPEAAPIPQRVTRVSSGAMRQKSVSEILGETPRHLATDKIATADIPSSLTPITSTPQSPTSRSRSGPGRRKDKSKAHVSAVVFGKSHKHAAEKGLVTREQKQEAFLPADDYFVPLFVQGFTQASKWMKPIEVVLNQAHKTVSTTDANIALQDNQACRVLRRVYNLQQQDKWLLRQPKRCPEPPRQETHWDVLLGEMKWMRTDFREERKWKTAVARNLAAACADWVASDAEGRKALQVRAILPPHPQVLEDDAVMTEADQEVPTTQPTPDLVACDVATPELFDELQDDIMGTVAPSAIFALQEDDVVFPLRSSPTADLLLEELPMYGPPLKIPSTHFSAGEIDPDAHWKRPALPLNKYVEGEMKLKSEGPPRKRSRYSYGQEDDDDEDRVIFGAQGSSKANVPPLSTEVALFIPEMKPIRDRLHASHQFRPPAEYSMPLQSFYECRQASQWTMAEDEELRELVRQYSYNWSFISNMLTPRGFYVAGAERRTPWECFERWINLEGLPSDMQKTQYFKSYQNRIDAAQRVIMQQNQVAQQQLQQQQSSGSNPPTTPVPRRRPSTPVRVERRRQQKHLTLIDAMRKLAKKREAAAQKQQHASQTAAMRKPNEAAQPRGSIKTPRDYSLMRWERDQALAEKVAQFHQRQETQRKALAQAARAQGQNGQVPSTPGAAQGVPNGAAQMNMARANIPGQHAAAGQGRGRLPMQAPQAALAQGQNQMGGLVPPMPMNGATPAQIQAAAAAMQAQQSRVPMQTQQQAEIMMQARRISEQQRQAQQMQQAQQLHSSQQIHPQGTQTPSHSPPNMRTNMVAMNGVVNGAPNGVNPAVNAVNGVNGINQQNYMANASAQAMMASFNAANGGNVSTPPANGLHMPNGPASSPRAPPAQSQNTIAVHFAALEAQYRQKNPMLTPEQAQRMAQDHITRVMMHRQNVNSMSQSAMNAAAGAANNGGMPSPSMGNGMVATPSPHQYAALLRQQQQAQAAQAAAQNNGQQQQQQSPQHPPQQHRSPQPPQVVQGQQQHQQVGQQQQHLPQQQQAQGTPQPQQQPLPQRTTPQQASPPPPQQQLSQLPQQPAQVQAQLQAQAQAQVIQQHQRQASGSATPSATG